jgi:hypothetical protein
MRALLRGRMDFGAVSKASRNLTLVAIMLAASCALQGCRDILISGLSFLSSDPRKRNHVYYADASIVFYVNNYNIRAVRYSDIYYLTGGSPGSPFPPCNAQKEYCWKMTDHFYIGLNNGDIFDIFVTQQNQNLLFAMQRKTPVRTTGELISVYRNQPDSVYAKEYGPCLRLSDEILLRDYGIVVSDNRHLVKGSIEITFETRDELSETNYIVDPSAFESDRILDKRSCGYLLKQASYQTKITAVE